MLTKVKEKHLPLQRYSDIYPHMESVYILMGRHIHVDIYRALFSKSAVTL